MRIKGKDGEMKRRRVQRTERGERGRQKGGKQNLHRVVKEQGAAGKGA